MAEYFLCNAYTAYRLLLTAHSYYLLHHLRRHHHHHHHHQVFRRSGYSEALILEDDLTEVADNFLARVDVIRRQLAKKTSWKYCYLGVHA